MNIEILIAIKRYYAVFGKSPTVDNVDTNKLFPCSSDTVMRRFNGFNAALIAAGVPVNKQCARQKILFVCNHCKKPFKSVKERPFCSRLCANTHRKKSKMCRYCGAEFNSRKGHGVYCDHTCHKNYEYTCYITAWKAGKVSGNCGRYCQVSAHVRRYLREKFKNQCTQCGWAEVHKITKVVPLTVEHIDGNAENTVEQNLDLICPNCHSLTSTYGSLNRGNGRKNRKR